MREIELPKDPSYFVLIELDKSFLGHTIVMTKPIEQDMVRQVKICRPAFQDFQRIFRRYYARSILNRHLLKLRWWSPDESSVIDLHWNRVPDTNLIELLIDPDGELPRGVRILFFEHSPNSVESTLWVLGGLIIDEEFSELQREVYLGRSLIVQERSD